MPPVPEDAAVLALWERAVGAPVPERADALLAASGRSAPASLGERNLRLIELHGDLFGGAIDLVSHCPACGVAAQFAGDVDAMAERCRSSEAATPYRLEWGAHAIDFRLPLASDVAAAAADAIADASDHDRGGAFARRLLERCVVSCRDAEGADASIDRLPDDALDLVSRRLETIDPGASIAFEVDCPACAEHWSAPLDLASLMWSKVQCAAEALLLQIDALARAYGWSEREILGLGPMRRAAYLQMATG